MSEGFDVVDEIVVGDLGDVKEQKSIMPATSRLKVRIAKAGLAENKDKDIKGLKLELRVVDGVPSPNEETGEVEMKYINKPLFTGVMDLCFWGNPETRNSKWWRQKQHMVEFKKFCMALGMDTSNIRINDEFFAELIDREVLVDVQHEEETLADSSTGERVKTGTFRERLRNWRVAA